MRQSILRVAQISFRHAALQRARRRAASTGASRCRRANLPTEQSLQHMLADLEVSDTLVAMYDLPDSVTLAMSALFLGYPVQRNDDFDSLTYLNYIASWF